MIFLNENRVRRDANFRRVFQFWTTVSGCIRCILPSQPMQERCHDEEIKRGEPDRRAPSVP